MRSKWPFGSPRPRRHTSSMAAGLRGSPISDRGHIRESRLLMQNRRTVLPATTQGVKDRQSITRWNSVAPALADLLAALAHGARDQALMGEMLAECGRQT